MPFIACMDLEVLAPIPQHQRSIFFNEPSWDLLMQKKKDPVQIAEWIS